MTQILDEVLAANAEYAKNFGDKGNLPAPPSRHFAILTCMDARLDPAKYAGLAEGDAHVIRNAGGRANDDAIRSLVISYKLLGTVSGSSSTTQIAGWCCSQTMTCASSWRAA
jgi:carbonic anhydrase